MDVSAPNPPLDALMIAAQAGDEAAYRALLKALAATLRSYFARRLGRDASVEDLVQDTLIAIHERRATYDPQRPFAAWFFAIARYKLIDHLRAARRSASSPVEEIEDIAGADEETPASARLDLERLLDGLPQRSRDIVRTVKIEGQSVAEVSLRSGLSPTAIRVLLHRAVKAMSAKVGNSRR
ncbi:sigma-70 family RNA polymerase sigma factor [Xanthobacter autotrophicus]|uniref:sigma-70 family RNA polymerase sigma factor n=1 Tax=Xanthobacter TaxID=279 RepID=UPI0024AA32A0|nr:sigma-70 family RNA polymerase sigma factor [Xanthobacter autotrophicus]MDI4663517.1 sigma-70 family RNA polymerase sigma factor [Xanthobacter autotrophicus]